MDKKTTGIIATVATALLCGCPGLFSMCFGFIAAVASQIPGSNIDVFGSSDPQSALIMGIGSLCLGVIFVIIPIVVGFFTLRKKTEETPYSNEPLPPAM
jgi:uncharacterized membrane protein